MWINHSLYKSKAFVLVLAFVALGAATALAQDEPVDPTDLKDTGWLPWIGCWELSEESVNRNELDMEGVALVCLAPTPDGQGVNITTVANGDVVLQEKFFADGIQRGVDEPGCVGWQSAEWSEDGRRLFLFSDTTCEGNVHRAISGVSLLVPGGYWVDIQSIVSGIRRELVIRRYVPAGSELSSGVFARLSIDNIIEAADKIDSEAVEAAVVETGTRIHIDSQALLNLSDSVVSSELIDLMVAMSFPEHFRIARRESSGSGGSLGGFGTDPLIASAEYAYGYHYPFYFAPFGYYSYSYAGYPGYYNLTPDVTPAASGGRVVAGRGYTKVWPKKPTISGGGGGFGGGSSSSSSSSGSVGKGGYSSGGGASSRTAKPKNDL